MGFVVADGSVEFTEVVEAYVVYLIGSGQGGRFGDFLTFLSSIYIERLLFA